MRACNINKMAYFYASCAVSVTIFSTGGKFCLVSNFTFCVLLQSVIIDIVAIVIFLSQTQAAVVRKWG